MENLAAEAQLAALGCIGASWQPMDTLRDKQNLNSLWESGGRAPGSCGKG